MKHHSQRRHVVVVPFLSLLTVLFLGLMQSCSNNNSPTTPNNPGATNTFTFSPTPVISNTATNSPTKTPTGTPTNSPTITPTSTPSNTATNSPTPTISNTPTDSPTFTETFTPTNTFTPTDTFTLQPTPVATNSWSMGTYITGLLVSGSSLYVADYSGGKLLKVNLAGTPVPGWPNPSVPNAWGIAEDGSGNVYVSQYSSNQVTVFNPAATPIATWTTGVSANGIVKDGSGNFYVGNYYNNSIQKYDTGGALLGSVSTGQNPIALGLIGSTLYAGDENDNVIRTYDLSLNPLPLTWTVANNSSAMATDSLGRLYSVNDGNQPIVRYTASGILETQWGICNCYGIATDGANNIYVSSYYSNGPISVYSP